MDKNDKTKDKKTATTASNAADAETQNSNDSGVVKELKQKIDELENQNKRILADYQNLEKRVAEERKEWILKGNKDLLLRLLPVLDTLMLATLHSKDQSLTVSLQQFLDVLKQQGVEKIKTIGTNFDPNSMECIETVEGEEGKVTEELRAGFTLYDKILRPAQVKVGSAKQNKGN
jgi:molecular chaperone GrpE